MTPKQADRIEAINVEIVKLILERAKVRRFGIWAQECAINEEIDKLEAKIKAVRAE